MEINEEYSVEKYNEMLETTPKYSLEVDPEGKYSMTDQQKTFIKFYVDTKNINFAAELAGIDSDTALAYFSSYATQQEIRRINLALFHRQFNAKMLSLDQIGSYLTSMLSGESIPLADQLKSVDKLRVVDLLIKLNDMKDRALANPSEIVYSDIDMQIKNLSLATIRQLLETSKSKQKPDEVYANIPSDVSVEEQAYLRTLPSKDLLKLLEKHNGGKNE